MSNSIEYSSYGASGTCLFNYYNNFEPYFLLGGTFVKTDTKRTPTLNFGLGNTYWLTERLGIQAEMIYKFSEKRFESMQSHFQFKLGFVFNFYVGQFFRRKSVCKINGF